VSIIYPDTAHVYLPDMWARMVDWMKLRLMGAQGQGGASSAAPAR